MSNDASNALENSVRWDEAKERYEIDEADLTAIFPALKQTPDIFVLSGEKYVYVIREESTTENVTIVESDQTG